MRVGYLSAKNYHSRKTFSGIVYAMRQSLGARPDVTVVDLGPPPPPTGLARITAKFGGGHQPFDLTQTSERARYAEHVRDRLDEEPADVLFAPVASVALSSVRIDLPVVYASDATFKLLATHYDLGLNHTQQRFRQGCEQAAIHRATRLIYSSQWAADSAIHDYGADPARIDVIPFGACIDDVPPLESLAQRTAPARAELRLLFVGKDYKRKGGALAVKAVQALREQGVQAELTLLGCVPPKPYPGVTAIEYLDKDDPSQAKRLSELYLRAHLFVFPTRADCTPIVLCEAAAFGLPTISTAVGGIPDLLRDDAGILIPPDADADALAGTILELVDEPQRYAAITAATRRAYEQRLNWEAWAVRAEASLRQAAGL